MTQPLLRASLLALSLALAACAAPTGPTPPFYEDLASPTAAIDANAAQRMISNYRTNNGLSPVVIDPALQRVAKAQADAMASANDVKASLQPGNRLSERLVRQGVGEVHAVENVSAGYRTLAEAFSGWRESPKHNAVMLDEKSTRMGIATAYVPGSKYKVFWSLVLAAP